MQYNDVTYLNLVYPGIVAVLAALISTYITTREKKQKGK